MIITVLFGQIKEEYEGQYAPEALAVADECTMDENPEYMDERIKDAEKVDEFSSIALIDINIDDDDVYRRLNPNKNIVVGDVL